MLQEQINHDLVVLTNQLSTLKEEMDYAIRSGRSFVEVKMIHLQIKELSLLIRRLKESNLKNAAGAGN